MHLILLQDMKGVEKKSKVVKICRRHRNFNTIGRTRKYTEINENARTIRNLFQIHEMPCLEKKKKKSKLGTKIICK